MSYVSTYFSPDRGAEDVIVGFIDRCTVSIDAAVYALTSDGITEALLRAVQRGVVVRVVTDTLQASSRYADDERLLEGGVLLRRDGRSGALHHKFCVGDGGTSKRAVKTGSYNWTKSANERNRENFVIVRLKYVVDAYMAEFDALWEALGEE